MRSVYRSFQTQCAILFISLFLFFYTTSPSVWNCWASLHFPFLFIFSFICFFFLSFPFYFTCTFFLLLAIPYFHNSWYISSSIYFLFLFLFLLHWLLAIFFSIILYSYLFSYFYVYNSVFLDSFISPSYFICLQFIYSFSHITIDIYNLFMCFVPSFLLSFKYSCKYSFFDSLLIIHIILILFSEYSDVNKSIFDGSYTATIFLKLTCSLLMLIWFDMRMHFYT